MKPRFRHPLLALAAALITPAAAENFCGCPSGASLLTPGTATCEIIDGSTIINLSGNTVIGWDQFAVPEGRAMQFNFANPAHTVVNRVTGTSPTLIAGELQSNGHVVILSPNSWLLIRPSAQITAGSFTASGLDADPAQFFDGSSEIKFHATAQSHPTTVIRGSIATTRGDVVLVGRELQVVGEINAAGSVTAVIGEQVTFQRHAPTATQTEGGGQIIQGGVVQAGGDIAFITQQALSMTGEMRAGDGHGRFFAKVSDGGNMLIGNAGLVIHARSAEFSTEPVGEVAFIPPAEGDNPGTATPALNEFPSLAANRTAARTTPTSSTITARAGTGFSKTEESETRQGSRALAENVPQVRKRSFFRTRATVTPSSPGR